MCTHFGTKILMTNREFNFLKPLRCTGGTPKSGNLDGKSYKVADLKTFGFYRSTNYTSFSVPELK